MSEPTDQRKGLSALLLLPEGGIGIRQNEKRKAEKSTKFRKVVGFG